MEWADDLYKCGFPSLQSIAYSADWFTVLNAFLRSMKSRWMSWCCSTQFSWNCLITKTISTIPSAFWSRTGSQTHHPICAWWSGSALCRPLSCLRCWGGLSHDGCHKRSGQACFCCWASVLACKWESRLCSLGGHGQSSSLHLLVPWCQEYRWGPSGRETGRFPQVKRWGLMLSFWMEKPVPEIWDSVSVLPLQK